ncbi:MAG TPA: LPXTG cell wall anchor domain-containing protein, partial [Acidimicrobiia bacterium]
PPTPEVPSSFAPSVPAGPAPSVPPPEEAGPAEANRLPLGAPAEELAPALPRTGGQSRPLAAAGGTSLFAAGLAMITGARHRRRRSGA